MAWGDMIQPWRIGDQAAAANEFRMTTQTANDPNEQYYYNWQQSHGYGAPTAQGGASSEEVNNLRQQLTDMQNRFGNISGGYASMLNENKTGWGAGTLGDLTSKYNQQYFNNLASFAQSTGPSDWLTSVRSRYGQQSLEAQEAARRQAATARLQGMEELGARRGLSTGAAERLATQGNLAEMLERQRIARGYAGMGAEADIAERAKKLDIQSMLPQLELDKARYESGLQQQSLSNLLEERAREHQYYLGRYQAEQARQGSESVANAQQASANRGMFQGILDIPSWFGM